MEFLTLHSPILIVAVPLLAAFITPLVSRIGNKFRDTVNVTFLGLGCRIKSALDPRHLMMGIPGSMLEMLNIHILDMAKPISMLNNSRKNV